MMKQKTIIRKRVVSILMVIAMICSGIFVPPTGQTQTVRAAETDDSEQEEEPYIEITNVSELYAIRNNLSGKYRLMNDIDLTEATAEGGEVNNTGHGWDPIDNFSGVLDGNGHVIKGMKIYGEVEGDVGLFGSTVYRTVYRDGLIQNLGLVDVDIDVKYIKRDYLRCGAIVGSAAHVDIENCFVTGKVMVVVEDGYLPSVGGVVGYDYDYVDIRNSYNLADVCSQDREGEYYSGTGGVMGRRDRFAEDMCIEKCYNAGNINNGKGYALVVGYDKNCESSFYLKGTGDAPGTPLTEAQMRNANYFTGWDFDTVWEIDPYSNYKYPQLKSCRQKRVKSLEIATPPAKMEYNQGEPLDISGATVKVTYEDGLETTIFLTEDMLGDYNMMLLGKQQIPIWKGNMTTTFEINVNAIPVEKVEMNKTNISVYKGYSEQLSASVIPENATNPKLDWSSADETIATVSSNGVVVGKKQGTTTIYAVSENGVRAECQVTITVPCAVLILDEYEITMDKGDTYVPTYKLSPIDSTDTVRWVSSDETVVHIEDNNRLIGVGGGTATVTGIAESGVSALCNVTVTQELSEFSVMDIKDMTYTGKAVTQTPTISNGTKTLRAGVDYSLEYSSNIEVGTATVQITGLGYYKGTLTRRFQILPLKIKSISIEKLPAKTNYKQGESLDIMDATIRITYENGEEKVIPLSEDMLGKYDMMLIGRQRIPVYVEDAETTIEIKVTEIPVTEVKLENDSLLLIKGQQKQLSAKVMPANATNPELTWTSSNKTIAEVNQDGIVVGKKAGTITVCASSENGVKAICKVTVIVPCVDMQLAENEIMMDVGDSMMLSYEMTPEDSTDAVKWTSEDEEIVAIGEDNDLVAVDVGTVKVTALADSGVSASCNVTVTQELSEFSVMDIKDMTYTGKAVTQTPIVTNGTKTLRAGVDYSLEYSSNVNVGRATVRIIGLGFYKGTLSRDFRIVLAKEDTKNSEKSSQESDEEQDEDDTQLHTVEAVSLPKAKISSIKASKKKLVVKWKRVQGASGYKIEMAKNRAFTRGKKTYTVGKNTLKKTLKGAKKTTYYVRVQAYTYDANGQISFGSYSSIKKKKTK